MATVEEIIKEAEYYLNNDVTVEQASVDLQVSKRTLQLHLKKLEEIAPEIFKLVRQKQAGRIQEGKVKGGKTGKRGSKWTEEQVLDIAKVMINSGMSYREAENYFGIPSSTLHEMVTKVTKGTGEESTLYVLGEANRRGMSIEEYIEKHKRTHPATEAIANEILEEKLTRGKK